MISAKKARDGTKVEEYYKEKCKDIESSIMLSMELGMCYTKYMGTLPLSISEMLKELGYEINEVPVFGSHITIISWGEPKKVLKCN